MPSFSTSTGLELAELLQVPESSIARKMKDLQASGEIRRVGPDKNGHWTVLVNVRMKNHSVWGNLPRFIRKSAERRAKAGVVGGR